MKLKLLCTLPVLTLILNIMSCSPSNPVNSVNAGKEADTYIYNIMNEDPATFGSVLANTKKWNVQILYTRINRAANGTPKLKTYTYNLSSGYFYPASTVKLPVALLALQRLNELNVPGLNKDATMITEAEGEEQTAVYNDPTTKDGRPTISNYIKKIFLVSDNDAFNRLYEFLGQEYINESLHQKGYSNVQILHRLSIPLTTEQNRRTNPVNFYDAAGKMIYSGKLKNNTKNYAPRMDSLGKAYYSGETLVEKPMNFSLKNRIGLDELHKMMISVVFPDAVPAENRFNLTEEDRMFILKYMSAFPGESDFPSYQKPEYYDAYSKFILNGNDKSDLNKSIRIFNKSGNAYGQLTDVTYVADLANKVEFFLSATILCNTDEILNDDRYDYETIGYPFMKELGSKIYAHELKRNKKRLPDLSSLTFSYDK